MPGKYAISYAEFVTTTGLVTLFRMAPAARKDIEMVYLAISGGGATAPADSAHEASFTFISGNGAGTLTSIVAEPLEPSLQAAGGTYGTSASAEPTTYSSVSSILSGFNQRGGMPPFGVPRGEGLKCVNGATNPNGGVRIRSSVAGKVSGFVHVYEP